MTTGVPPFVDSEEEAQKSVRKMPLTGERGGLIHSVGRWGTIILITF